MSGLSVLYLVFAETTLAGEPTDGGFDCAFNVTFVAWIIFDFHFYEICEVSYYVRFVK